MVICFGSSTDDISMYNYDTLVRNCAKGNLQCKTKRENQLKTSIYNYIYYLDNTDMYLLVD